MVRLKKSLSEKTCIHGHDLLGTNRRSNGRCGECMRKSQGWKGSQANKQKTHCPHGHPYDGDNLVVYKRGKNKIRFCRACHTERSREYYWRVVKPAKHPGPPGRPRKNGLT